MLSSNYLKLNTPFLCAVSYYILYLRETAHSSTTRTAQNCIYNFSPPGWPVKCHLQKGIGVKKKLFVLCSITGFCLGVSCEGQRVETWPERFPDRPPVTGYTRQNNNSILDWVRIATREGEALWGVDTCAGFARRGLQDYKITRLRFSLLRSCLIALRGKRRKTAIPSLFNTELMTWRGVELTEEEATWFIIFFKIFFSS